MCVQGPSFHTKKQLNMNLCVLAAKVTLSLMLTMGNIYLRAYVQSESVSGGDNFADFFLDNIDFAHESFHCFVDFVVRVHDLLENF